MYKISLELKVSMLFGIIAFFVSLLFGSMVGNKIGILISRVLFFTVVYAALGYGSLVIIKRRVPEVYEILNQSFGFSKRNVSQEEYVTVKPNELNAVQEEGPNGNEENTPDISISKKADTSQTEVFTPLESKDYTNLSTKDSKPKKMGKHIVLDDKKIQYEPKVMAEAIRTMIKRDKD
ncbi:MAG: hypothetical protein ACUVRK_03000 [Spirochaetota bacterium]